MKAKFVKSITLTDPDTGDEVGLDVYKLKNGAVVGFFQETLKDLNVTVLWDELEYHPVKRTEHIDENGKHVVEQCEPDKADFWSVYAHNLQGGLHCIADLETEQQCIDFIGLYSTLKETELPDQEYWMFGGEAKRLYYNGGEDGNAGIDAVIADIKANKRFDGAMQTFSSNDSFEHFYSFAEGWMGAVKLTSNEYDQLNEAIDKFVPRDEQ